MAASKADDYRAKAAECESRALASADGGVKAQYRELARQWLEMAKQADWLAR